MPATLFATRHKVFHFSKNASASFPVLCQNEEGERVIPRSSNQRETFKDMFHKEPTTTPTCSALFLSAVLNLGRSNCSCPCLSGKCSLHLNLNLVVSTEQPRCVVFSVGVRLTEPMLLRHSFVQDSCTAEEDGSTGLLNVVIQHLFLP